MDNLPWCIRTKIIIIISLGSMMLIRCAQALNIHDTQPIVEGMLVVAACLSVSDVLMLGIYLHDSFSKRL